MGYTGKKGDHLVSVQRQQFSKGLWIPFFRDWMVLYAINMMSFSTGKTTEQHLKSLEMVLTRIDEYGLRLNWAKCLFLSRIATLCD